LITLEEVKAAAARFLSEKWDVPVEVTAISKIFGGASRETYRLTLSVDGKLKRVIVRRDPPSSLIDTERALEYGAYQKIFPTDIPVPEPLFIEVDPSYLGQPFSVMAAIEDCQTDVTPLSTEARRNLGEQKYQILGRLAANNPIDLGFDSITPAPDLDQCASEQLSYWRDVILDDEIHPQPIAQAAIRWLGSNLPAPAQKLAIVHGDYRTGNFLFNTQNEITGVLDWEMCHLGDPLEDLAWSLDPLWTWGEPGLAGRLLPVDEAIEIWCGTSGLDCDRIALKWWRIFAALKAIAIWISSSEDFHHGEGKDSILAMAGWVMTDRQNKILLDYLVPDELADADQETETVAATGAPK
jgi:aminoglycoside phosphotransferase (APT) family kinase protein